MSALHNNDIFGNKINEIKKAGISLTIFQQEKVLSVEELIEKGEGSKGGKVIGHTKSGKAIYLPTKDSHLSQTAHKSYDKQDHLDAAALHKKKAEHHSGKEDEEFYMNGNEDNDKSRAHAGRSRVHERVRKFHQGEADMFHESGNSDLQRDKNGHDEKDRKNNAKFTNEEHFKKSKDIKKGELSYSLNTENLTFEKKGKELKPLITTKLGQLQERYDSIEEQREEQKEIILESKPECVKFTKDSNGYESYTCNDWKLFEQLPVEVRTACNQYNNLGYQCQSLKEDIKILKVFEDNLEENKTYKVTPRQLSTLQKSEVIEALNQLGI